MPTYTKSTAFNIIQHWVLYCLKETHLKYKWFLSTVFYQIFEKMTKIDEDFISENKFLRNIGKIKRNNHLLLDQIVYNTIEKKTY